MQQPDLRPFIVYDHCPDHCIPFAVADTDTLPLLVPGDVVLVDTSDREPSHCDLFLIQWSSGRRAVVETFLREDLYGTGVNGQFAMSFCWFAGSYDRPRSLGELSAWIAARRAPRFVDGPYPAEGERADAFKSKLVGRVVGLLDPSFEEPKRIAREVSP